MDTAQFWPQGVGVQVKPMESSRPMLERRTRPQTDQVLNCPRCNSTNTKFCYYNNYSLSQPRYFCKTCRRYWTEGGSLRSVPVGGGSRKNKRSSSSTPSASNSGCSNKKLIPDHHHHHHHHHHLNSVSGLAQSALQNPKIDRSLQDLNLTFPLSDNQDYSTVQFVEVPYSSSADEKRQQLQNPNSSSANSQLSAVELLKSTGINSSRGIGSFMGIPVSHDHSSAAMYSGGYSLQDFKPSLNFSSEGFHENGYGSLPGIQDSTGAKIFFPVEELKQQVPTTTEFEQIMNRSQADQSTSGYWNGMLGGGGSW